MYLFTEFSNNCYGQECLAMYSGNYCTAAVKNVESVFEKRGLRLPPKCVRPLSCGYHQEMDVIKETKADGVKWYQELIGTLMWEM